MNAQSNYLENLITLSKNASIKMDFHHDFVSLTITESIKSVITFDDDSSINSIIRPLVTSVDHKSINSEIHGSLSISFNYLTLRYYIYINIGSIYAFCSDIKEIGEFHTSVRTWMTYRTEQAIFHIHKLREKYQYEVPSLTDIIGAVSTYLIMDMPNHYIFAHEGYYVIYYDIEAIVKLAKFNPPEYYYNELIQKLHKFYANIIDFLKKYKTDSEELFYKRSYVLEENFIIPINKMVNKYGIGISFTPKIYCKNTNTWVYQ